MKGPELYKLPPPIMASPQSCQQETDGPGKLLATGMQGRWEAYTPGD